MKPLVLECLQAQKEYVTKHIDSPKGKLYYNEMMDNIQRVVQSFDNYYGPLFVLEMSFAQMRESWFSLNQELKYKKLALQHTTDVIVSLNKRFGNAQS